MIGIVEMASRLETAHSGEDVASEAVNAADRLRDIAEAWGQYQRSGVGTRQAASAKLDRLIEGGA